MAIYDFYNGYDINDANIGCGRIIVSDCNGHHHYENLCSLIQTCVDNIDGQLTSDCVVDFLNDLDSQPVGYYLRINSSHCLEAVALNIPTYDCTVKATSSDGTCGYLEQKIIAGSGITITVDGPASNQYLTITSSAPVSITDLADIPSSIYNACDSTTNAFMYKLFTIDTVNNTIDSECIYHYMGSLYLNSDITIGSPDITPNQAASHRIISGLDNYEGDNGIHISKNVTSSSYTRGGSTTVSALKAPVSGIYRITIKGNARVNPGVQAIRMYVVSSNSASHGCVDSKFGAGNNPLQPMVWNYNETLNEDSDTYIQFNGTTQVYLDQDVALSLGLGIDCAAGTGIQPKVTLLASGLTGGTYEDPSGFMSVRSGISLQMEFIRSKPFDVTF